MGAGRMSDMPDAVPSSSPSLLLFLILSCGKWAESHSCFAAFADYILRWH